MIERVYIAAALFTPQQIRVNGQIAAIVNTIGMEPFLPSEMSAPIWKGRAPKDCSPEDRALVVQKNKNGMRESRVMIARVSGDTKEVDTGVAWEMGYFQCLAEMEEGYIEPDPPLRTLIAYIEPSDRAQSLNLMLAETVHAACYGSAQLHECLTALSAAHAAVYPLTVGAQRDGIRKAIEPWHPSKIVMHEREPIGVDSQAGDGNVSVNRVDNSSVNITMSHPHNMPPGYEGITPAQAEALRRRQRHA